MRHSLTTASLIATLALSACGGGGGGDSSINSSGSGSSSDAVPLATAADVQRELGNIGVVGKLARSSGFTAQVSTSAAGSASGLGGATAATQAQHALAAPGALRPQAASQNCSGGGSASGTSGNASHSFAYFDVTETVSYASVDFSSCVEAQTNSDGSTSTVTLNNHGEAGNTTTAGDGSQYAYTIFGSGSTPLSVQDVETDANGNVTLNTVDKLLGTLEAYATSTDDEARTLLHDDHSESRSTGSYVATIDLGKDTTPFDLITATDASTESLTGRYTYSSSLCSGGAVDLTTPATVANDSNGYPVGGSLKFASGSASVAVIFNSDGSASLQFSTGATDSLTADEVHSALDTAQC